jgi:hypothetical protein
MPDFSIPPELIEHLNRGDCVLFLGADLPREMTSLPSRADLARDMARRYRLDESLSLAEVAQRVSQAGNRFEFTEFIRNALDTAGKSPSAFHQGIVALVKEHGISTIITTAYDNLLEVAFQQAGVGLNRVVRGSDVSFIRPDRPTLIKLYGDAQQPDTLVVTDRDHALLLRDRDKEDVIDEVRRAFKRNTILFYGYNLSDLDFKFLFDQIAESKFARLAYAVWPPKVPEADVRMWRDRGIVILKDDPLGVMSAGLLDDVAPSRKYIPKMDGGLSYEMQAESVIAVEGPDITPPVPDTTRGQPPIEVQPLRVDAAVPEQVFVNRTFDLAVAVRQMSSPLLALKDLTHVESGDLPTTWKAHIPFINLRAEVDAPDCEISGKTSIPFRLIRGKDASPLYFHLKPLREGDLSIVVTVYQEDYALGSARVSTVAAAQTTLPAVQVPLIVSSQALWLDCEVRIYDRSDVGYKVEMTLNGEQAIEGRLSPDVVAFIPSGDPRAEGQRLFDTLFADKDLREAWGEARGQSKQRRIRLRIDARELRSLPWELLRDDDDILAAQADTPFSRYLATEQPWGGAIAARPIRVLAVISNPTDLKEKYDLPSADVSVETSALRVALAPSPSQGEGRGEDVSLTFLPAPITLARLEEALQQGYHILHFIGHGAFNEKKQQAALYLQNDEGTAQRVSDDEFAGMLKRLSAPPQLIVLAACQSATQAQTATFSGLSPKLVQIGIPAVVAMQDNVTVLTARQFSTKFYRRLLEHGTVDRAMNEARSLLITNGRFDAAVPVLFMRLRDGRLWGEAASATPVTPTMIDNQINVAGNYVDQSTHGDTSNIKIEKVETLNLGGGAKHAARAQPASTAADDAERASLERQRAELRENLRLIEERKAEYVLEVDVPLQLVKEERRLKARLADVERKLTAD